MEVLVEKRKERKLVSGYQEGGRMVVFQKKKNRVEILVRLFPVRPYVGISCFFKTSKWMSNEVQSNKIIIPL